MTGAESDGHARTRVMRVRRVRVLRGALAAAIAVLIASTAHTLAGGDAPPLWLAVAVAILAAPLCIALVGSRRSGARALPRLAAAVATAQIALHAAFAAVGDTAPRASAPGAPTVAAHHHTLDMSALLGSAPSSITAMDATMTAGHVCAAALTFLVLAWGEQLIAAIARGIRQLLRRRALSPHRPHLRPAPVAGRDAPVATRLLFLCAMRRGPPAGPALLLAA